MKTLVYPWVCLGLLGFTGCAGFFSPVPPPDFSFYNKTMYLVVTSEPAGLPVYAQESDWLYWRDKELKKSHLIGKTPLEVPVRFSDWEGSRWFLANDLLPEPKQWNPALDVTDRIFYPQYPMRFYVDGGDEFYSLFVSTALRFVDYKGEKVWNDKAVRAEPMVDGYRITKENFPIKLVPHGRVFSRRLVSVIEKGDYYGAEELRLTRLKELKELLGAAKRYADLRENQEFTFEGYTPNSIQLQLIHAEVDRLEYLVGLLDPTLMGLRKQLVAKLNQGGTEGLLPLAKAIAEIEKRYLPESPAAVSPFPPIVLQALPTSGGPQQVVVQQKPYYGATHIVAALAALEGSDADPQAVQKAFGGAQLLDVLGFADELNQ